MTIKLVISGMLLGLVATHVWAGDAIAVGYDGAGVWTSVTYYRSSTPKGGAHYWDAAQAGAFAERDLHSRGGMDVAGTQIIGQSDKTGFVAVAHGKKTNANTGVTTVGRGQSQAEADKNAMAKLSERSATEEGKIVYRYFSYGADSASSSHSKRRNTHTG